MDTRHLRGFLKIAETRSISRAAESLGIAQPSLSQQLLRLEDEVGIALFRRTSKGVDLTEGGRVFQEHARLLLRAAEQAIQDTHRTTDDIRAGRVSIARVHAATFRRTLCLVRNTGRIVSHALVRVEDLTLKLFASLIEQGHWRARPIITEDAWPPPRAILTFPPGCPVPPRG